MSLWFRVLWITAACSFISINYSSAFDHVREFPGGGECYWDDDWEGIRCRGLSVIPNISDLRPTELHLNGSNITSIHEDDFLGLESLQGLLLVNNGINSIERGRFKHLTKLRILDLRGNNITSIHEDDFLGLESLEVLSLVNNSISSIDRGSFKHLKSLRKLLLDHNNIASIHEGDFLGLESLRVLRLNGSRISSIERGSYKHLMHLEELWLNDNNITSIHEDDFLGLESLQLLSLVNNKISSIERGSFKNLTKLRNLGLDRNNITSIHEDDFLGLESLQKLYLRNNRISSIERGSFKHLIHLEELGLDRNNITSIHEDDFLGLKSLLELQLYDNGISSIERGNFKHLTRLEKLNLDGNSITSIDEDDFFGLESLQLLYLWGNRITSIERGSFKHLKSLVVLWLNDNNITSIHEDDFLGLEFLRSLYLQVNSISSIEKGSFKHFTSLTHLRLSENRITSLEAGIFTGLTSLTHLILQKNKITHIETESFLGLENLTTLALLGNKIERIDPGALVFSSKLQWITSDDWKVCCIAHKQHVNCSTDPSISIYRGEFPERLFSNPFSSCEDLMHNTVLRNTVWTLGVFAAAFNMGVVLWRIASRTKPAGSRSLQESHQIQKILSSSLALGDFFMGVFLLIIASADWHFRGHYILQDENWRSSWICKLAGFSCVFSSELSVFTLTILSLERFWKLTSPGGANRLSARGIKILVGVSFGLAVVFAGIPLLPIDYFRDFYGNSSVCLALPLTTNSSDADKMTHVTNQQPGWEYSFFVFVVLNALSMVIITFCYVTILRTVKQSTREAKVSRDKTETLLLWRIILIVGTDMLCWLPVIFVSIVNLVFWELSNTAYAWIAVFVLPINSALNPIIYTFYTPAFRRAVTKKWNRVKAIKLFQLNQN